MPKLADHKPPKLAAVPDPVPDTEPPPTAPAPEEGEQAELEEPAAAPAKKAAPVKKAAAKKAAAPKTGGTGGLLASATSLADADDFVNILYTGPQGSGKTTACARMANLGKVVYLNAEGGAKRKALAKQGVDVSNIMVLPEDPEMLSYDYLDDLFWEIKSALDDDPKAYAGVVWDSVTEIHDKVLQKIRDYQNDKAARKGQSRMKDTDAGDLLDRFFTDISDYGFMTDQMKLLLRRYRDLPCHFAATALIQRDKDSNGKVVYRPAMTPKLAEKLVGYVDMVAVTSVGEYRGHEEYRGQFRPIGLYEGKDRFGVTPKILINPTFDRIVEYVNGGLEPANDPVMLAAKALRDANAEADVADAAAAEEETDADEASDS